MTTDSLLRKFASSRPKNETWTSKPSVLEWGVSVGVPVSRKQAQEIAAKYNAEGEKRRESARYERLRPYIEQAKKSMDGPDEWGSMEEYEEAAIQSAEELEAADEEARRLETVANNRDDRELARSKRFEHEILSVRDELIAWLDSLGIEHSIEKAGSGSQYLSVDTPKGEIVVRFADHVPATVGQRGRLRRTGGFDERAMERNSAPDFSIHLLSGSEARMAKADEYKAWQSDEVEAVEAAIRKATAETAQPPAPPGR
jgi:hypothetical protein